MKKIVFVIISQACLLFCHAQLPTGKQSDEMKQMIAELKKEISAIGDEIKKAEKEDPEAVASLKAQLNTYKTMLAAFDKSKPAEAKPKTSVPAAKNKLPQTLSPILPVHLKQPVSAPTAAQANDLFFWYKGRKINDSTLVTTRKTVVQYSRKRNMLIVQPDEKKDSFLSIAKEITRSEQRKQALAEQFDKTKNGFIYYPYITTAFAIYDDLQKRFSDAANNTIPFDTQLPNISLQRSGSNKPKRAINGPHASEEMFLANELSADSLPNLLDWVLEQLDDAQKRWNQLPAVEDFPAPPPHDLGRCATCDTTAISRQRRLDEKWTEAYQGKEASIIRQALSAMRAHALLGGEESDDLVYEKFAPLFESFNQRMQQKDQLLMTRYGDELKYLPVIVPVVLGHERQRQLLGAGEASSIGDIMGKTYSAYRKYYDEQKAAKNYDFILNVPFHAGMSRQIALLGSEEVAGNLFQNYFQDLLSYNRFALTMEMDFIWQKEADGELQLRATGTMATPAKVYTMLIPDSCAYRLMAYTTDLANKKFEDITLPLKVKSGVKTMRDENGKLKDYPYQGPPEYAFRFPDCKINFCDNGQDTLLLALIGGNEEVAARAPGDIQNIGKAYTIDMLLYAGQVLINEDANEMIEGTQDAGNKILATVTGFMQQGSPGTTLEKLKMQYEGYMDMDNLRKSFEGSFASQTAKILFNANNRSTVLTDTYVDTKRKMYDDVEVKRGLFHLRLVHEPKE